MTLSNHFTDKFLLDLSSSSESSDYREEILVDTDALVALYKTDDSNHPKAIKISDQLQEKGAEFCLSPFTIYEAATVISYKVSHKAAIDFIKEIKNIDLPVYELPTDQTELAEKWFFKQTGKGISYFDCYNMALLEKYKMKTIFSFDSIYKKNGFRLCG